MDKTEFSRQLSAERISRPMLEAATRAYRAIFEGLSPSQKTRRAIREFMEEPPGGWDSPALGNDGSPFVSEHGNEMSWAVALEAYIRGEFFHRRGMPDKFEPGIARIAYTEMGLWPDGIKDYRSEKPSPREDVEDLISEVRRIVGLLSGPAHVNDFTFDLDGMGLDELLRRFGSREGESTGSSMVDTGSTRYRVVRVDSFEQSKEFAHFFDSNPKDRWCIIGSKEYWNRYTRRGKNTAYYLIAPGAEEMTAHRGENCPKDEYGLSLIGIMIGPRGTLEHCCVRWNYSNGASDHELSADELSELLGRPLEVLCPPRERKEGEVSTYEELMAAIKKADDPFSAYAANGGTVRELAGKAWPEYRYVTIELDEDATEILIHADTGMPVINMYQEDTAVEILDDKAILVTMRGEEDEWGDVNRHYVLVTHGGQYTYLGPSDNNGYDGSEYFYNISEVSATGLPGLYCLSTDNDEFGDLLIGPGGGEATHRHTTIDVYPQDSLVICDSGNMEDWTEDISDGSADSYDGLPEIMSYDRESGRLGFVLSPANDPPPDFLETCTIGTDRVNVLYNQGHDLILITGGQPRKIGEINLRQYSDEIPLKDDSVFVFRMLDGTYSIFSMKRGEFLATDLEKRPRKGIYRRRGDEFEEIYTSGEPVLGGKYVHISYADRGPNRTPWHTGRLFIGNYMHDDEVCECTDRDGRTWLADLRDGKLIYDFPVKPGSYPYSEHAIMEPTGDSERPYVIADLEGNPVTEPFTRTGTFVGHQQAIYIGTDLKRIMLVDGVTGRPESPWLVSLKEFASGYWSHDIYLAEREDRKLTLYRQLPYSSTSSGIPGTLKQADLGWVDDIWQVMNSNVVKVTSGEETFLYDCLNFRKLDWEPTVESVRRHMEEFAAEHHRDLLQYVTRNGWSSYYVDKLISAYPSWALGSTE